MSNTPNTPNLSNLGRSPNAEKIAGDPQKFMGQTWKNGLQNDKIIVKIDFFALAAPIGTTGDLFHS